MRDLMVNKSVAPKLAQSIYSKALDYDVYLSFGDQNIVTAPFTDACFYPDGFTIHLNDRTIACDIVVEGDMYITKLNGIDNIVITAWDQLRELCPDGDVDDGFEIHANPWFSLKQIIADHGNGLFEIYDAGFEEGFITHDIVTAVDLAFTYMDGL